MRHTVLLQSQLLMQLHLIPLAMILNLISNLDVVKVLTFALIPSPSLFKSAEAGLTERELR